nr:PREDICTED: solute carrier family 41 member 1 [Latimeria chalumnae]|eukprot:XP_014346539.1 PREDICTED: solute carrier family 41 member 1 [Latimeria chalumnae]
MSSSTDQKELHQANGVVHPMTVSLENHVSPGREQVATTEFSGEDTSERDKAEVVVIDSRANAKGVREEDALLENGSQSNESDDTSTDQSRGPGSILKESSFSIGLQVLFPFLLAGFGTVAAGMVLDIVQVSSKGTG